MRYLYGDSSCFPLNDNFIETLEAATDCCVALLEVDEAIVGARRTCQEANAAATAELADIEQLTHRIEAAFAGSDQLSQATGKVAAEVRQLSRQHFDRARAGIKAWRDGVLRKARARCGPAAIMQPLQDFMLRHQLPYTAWGLRWKAGRGDEPVQAQVYAIMQRGLTATLAVDIPRKHLWAQPVRVAQLHKGVVIQLLGKSWLGKECMRDEPLDKLFVTRVTCTTEREAVILCRKAKEPSPGIRISFREGDLERLTVMRVDEQERPISEPTELHGLDAEAVRGLWRRVKETAMDLVASRSQLLAATLRGKTVTELETPSLVAGAMIQSLAPLVRDIARHSSTPGELQLKRELGDGRREELFCAHATILGKLVNLGPENRALFDIFALAPSRSRAAQAPASRPRASAAQASTPAPAPVSRERPRERPSQPMMLTRQGSSAPPPSQPAVAARPATTEDSGERPSRRSRPRQSPASSPAALRAARAVASPVAAPNFDGHPASQPPLHALPPPSIPPPRPAPLRPLAAIPAPTPPPPAGAQRWDDAPPRYSTFPPPAPQWNQSPAYEIPRPSMPPRRRVS